MTRELVERNAKFVELANAGMNSREIAFEVGGVSESAVRAALARKGIRFKGPRRKLQDYREKVDGMKPLEAVEYLLWCVEELLPDIEKAPIEGLTICESRLVQALMSAGENGLSKDGLFRAVYFDQLDQPTNKIVDVWICKVRRKLGPACITTIWGWGYRWAGSA